MPRPVESSPASDSPDSSLCDRIQQFRQRMRSRCLESRWSCHSSTGTDTQGSSSAMPVPCLLQSWRKRIEAMESQQDINAGHNYTQRHNHGHKLFGHRRPCYKAPSSSSTDSEEGSSPPPPMCRGPRMLHPRLERQQAVCSLSGIWSGFSPSSPPPEPEIYAKPRHRRHPYARCSRGFEATDDHGKSS